MISRQLKIISVSMLLTFVAACQQQNKEDLPSFVENAYKDQKPEIEPLPPIVPYEEFIYSAGVLSDPFSKNNVLFGNESGAEGQGGPDENRRKEPLEAFPLDGLRLDGVLEFKGQLSAIIRSPDGDSVPVTIGNYMGLNGGKILSINSEEQVLEIEETVRNATGEWVKKTIKMTGEEESTKNERGS